MTGFSLFKLTEPGATLIRDPSVREYLKTYNCPIPPNVRYGHIRLESPQDQFRVALFGQAWVPDHSLGTVFLIHGFSEHTGNYGRLIQDFTNARLAVAAIDLRGHGLSEGPRGHTDSPECYAEDVEKFAQVVSPTLNPNRPFFLFGHSLGGLIALHLMLRNRMPAKIAAAVITSPLLGLPTLAGLPKILASVSPIAEKFFPTLGFPHNISDNTLSHDNEYLDRRAQDPLINGKASPRWVNCIKALMEEIHLNAGEFHRLAPTFLMLAGDEHVTNLNESRRFAFHGLADRKHKIVEFPGYYHELEKERGIRDRVVRETIAWFTSHAEE